MNNDSIVRAVVVDDSDEDLKHADRLSSGDLACSKLSPSDTAEELCAVIVDLKQAGKCDVVILDYRLDSEVDGGSGVSRRYRGGTAAALLKEVAPELPVVLMTTEAKYEASLTGRSEVRRLFDHTVLKSAIVDRERRPGVRLGVTALARGFATIASSTGSGWPRMYALLDAPSAGREFELRDLPLAPVGVSESAQWLLHEALAYEGPLLSGAAAAALLGLEEKDLRSGLVDPLVSNCRYEGVFSEWKARWWREGIEAVLAAAGDGGRSHGADRASDLSAKLGLGEAALSHAVCVWCGGPDVAQACSLCSQPVDPKHHLVATIDDRPAWVDPAIVCFRCIANGSADGTRVHAGGESIVARLKSGQLLPEPFVE